METEYKKLLQNPKWQKKRLEILQRDNFSCVVCGNGIETDTALHVHHLSYMKGRMTWEYDISQLPTPKGMSLQMVSQGNANLQGQPPTPKGMNLQKLS